MEKDEKKETNKINLRTGKPSLHITQGWFFISKSWRMPKEVFANLVEK